MDAFEVEIKEVQTPESSVLHLAVGRPCEKPYVAYRPLAGELPPGVVTGEAALRRLRNHAMPPDMYCAA